ncbi:MAG: fatty acid desaturase [Anaeromyxobacter sp.]|nr:fatty acid desaturase [Anaeromyxobacter sp.]MBL0277965.1 fatty acid desaturase [Anaeromyxobacter sp.]
MASLRDPDRINWGGGSIPFLFVHAVALATPFLVPVSPALLGLAVATYAIRMFGITAGYHRYFAHRAYRTGRVFQFVLAWLGAMSSQKGPLWWAAHHRHHHRWSDTDQDLHSPVRGGFLWSHVGWFLVSRYEQTRLDQIKDFARFPELRWIDRWHAVPGLTLALGLFLVGGWPALLWGYFLSTAVLWHGTFVINSLAHVMGRRRYETGDESRNSFLLALVTFGEGWHNNHHFYAATANQGWFWWEVDLSYAVLKLLGAAGLVSDLRTPPPHIRYAHLRVDAGRTGPAAGGAAAPAEAAEADARAVGEAA